MIASAYLWSNGMVTVFDGDGLQMPAYQGAAERVLGAVLREAPAAARFYVGDWENGVVQTNRAKLAHLANQLRSAPP